MTIECPIYYEEESAQHWIDAFVRQCPHLDVKDWQQVERPEDVHYGIVWRPSAEFFARFPNLKAVLNLGAGVDGILRHPQLPDSVQVLRLENAGMGAQMNEYFAYHVMHFHRHMDRYHAQQNNAQWQVFPGQPAKDFRVGILGLGELGSSVASCLQGFGYTLSGWSRSQKALDGIKCYAGAEQLDQFLSEVDALCCLLPLTDATRDILNKDNMSKLPKGAVIINAARGEHLVEEDLLELLNSGHLRGAVVDTLRTEPLSSDSPLWSQPGLIITPHCAAQSWLEPSVEQIGKNIDAMLAGQQPSGIVERKRGY